jgi:hypothetical protein
MAKKDVLDLLKPPNEVVYDLARMRQELEDAAALGAGPEYARLLKAEIERMPPGPPREAAMREFERTTKRLDIKYELAPPPTGSLADRMARAKHLDTYRKHMAAVDEPAYQGDTKAAAEGTQNGQYFPELVRNGEAGIRDIEAKALKEGIVQDHGGTAYFYYRSDKPVGYAWDRRTGKAVPTYWVRVELDANGTVHSHPRSEAQVREDLGPRFPAK